MRIFPLGFMAILLFFSACSGGNTTPSQSEGGVPLVEEFLATSLSLAPYQTGKSYEVNGAAYTPEEDFSYSQSGLASYYGNGLDGALTASGETYHATEYTAAHKTLPFQTLVRVTHLSNGKSAVVRINDRGPFIEGRIIDLSGRAANALDMVEEGVASVKVEILAEETQIFRDALKNGRVILSPPPLETAGQITPVATSIPLNTTIDAPISQPASGGFYVVVGTYTDQTDANAIRDRMSHLGTSFVEQADNLYRVLIGPLSSRLDAQAMLGRVFAQGATNSRVVQR